MINRLFLDGLKKYDSNDKELFLKAKFLLVTIFFALITVVVTVIYTCYTFGIGSLTVFTQLVGFILILSSLILLVNGRYFLAAHVILSTVFCVVWILMFTEPVSTILIKIDTIVFIPCILAAMPLLFFKTRKHMLFYFIINYAVFILFIYYLTQVADLTVREYVDYTLDNTVAMLLVFGIGYNLFTIYQQILDSFRNEIRERKKAEQSLKKLRLFLSGIINSMPSVIVGINEDCHVVLWNEEASNITGVDQHQAMSANVFDIFPGLIRFEEPIKTVISENKTFKAHKKEFTCLGQAVFMDVTVFPLFHDGTGGAVIRLDDISEHLKMEEVMIQSEKMLSLGGLAAGMAHEINNPLAGMMQNAQVVLSRLTQDFPANQMAAEKHGITMAAIKGYMEDRNILRSLEHINNSGCHAAGIVKNMLSFAKNTKDSRKPEDLSAIIENAVNLAVNDWDLNHSHDFKKIKIIRDYMPDLKPVLCEKTKIQQVVFNIIKNASEAMGMGNQENEAPELILRLAKDQAMVRIEIQDNGPGMDSEVKKRIFEPFFTTKGVDKGTGLGLSVSYFIIVDDHGGKMDVDSSPGKGAKFIIRLPL